MTPLENPFTPSFGEVPAHLAGRQHVISSITKAFSSAKRRPELTSLFSGARGTGKTTLLSLLAERAEESGWISISTTAMPGMLEDLEISLRERAAHLTAANAGKRITSVEIAGIGGMGFAESEEALTNWRSRMTALIDQLAEKEIGLLITVDEIDPQLDEMVELAAVYQHFVRENRKVGLLMAGLPFNIDSLLSDKTVSFLRRAQTFELGRVEDFEVRDALTRTIREGGRTADSSGIDLAVQAAAGFPFMIQLVGFRSWDANPEAKGISAQDFEAGIEIAKDEMNSRILRSTYRDLSDADIKFLAAMLEDEKDSTLADIRQRLGWSPSQTSQYKLRLLRAGIVEEQGRGIVSFELPFFREFLQRELQA